MYRRTASTTRSAFTLVELLVVISIIGLLMGLILPAVQKVRVSGKRAQTGAEISQLSAAAASFKQEFKIYPPDTFDSSTPAGIAILQQMYPRWNPVTSPAALTGPLVGIECLFYFTTGPDNRGWAIDGPFNPGPTAKGKGPYFEYGGAPLAKQYRLIDPFGNPYAYFVSSPGGKYNSAPWEYTNTEGLRTTVKPYLNIGSRDKFVNSDSVQIISAGANGSKVDGGFGPGGIDITLFSKWKPGSGPYDDGFRPLFPNPPPATPNDGSGADDMANFHGGKQLGAE